MDVRASVQRALLVTSLRRKEVFFMVSSAAVRRPSQPCLPAVSAPFAQFIPRLSAQRQSSLPARGQCLLLHCPTERHCSHGPPLRPPQALNAFVNSTMRERYCPPGKYCPLDAMSPNNASALQVRCGQLIPAVPAPAALGAACRAAAAVPERAPCPSALSVRPVRPPAEAAGCGCLGAVPGRHHEEVYREACGQLNAEHGFGGIPLSVGAHYSGEFVIIQPGARPPLERQRGFAGGGFAWPGGLCRGGLCHGGQGWEGGASPGLAGSAALKLKLVSNA